CRRERDPHLQIPGRRGSLGRVDKSWAILASEVSGCHWWLVHQCSGRDLRGLLEGRTGGQATSGTLKDSLPWSTVLPQDLSTRPKHPDTIFLEFRVPGVPSPGPRSGGRGAGVPGTGPRAP